MVKLLLHISLFFVLAFITITRRRFRLECGFNELGIFEYFFLKEKSYFSLSSLDFSIYLACHSLFHYSDTRRQREKKTEEREREEETKERGNKIRAANLN
jgi:hypothetical protein